MLPNRFGQRLGQKSLWGNRESKKTNDLNKHNLRILLCNFRAPNLQQYQRWKAYVQRAKDKGTDVCDVTLSLTDSFKKGTEGAAQVLTENR